jgi:hypothetical protein
VERYWAVAPPEKGKANEAVVGLVAGRFARLPDRFDEATEVSSARLYPFMGVSAGAVRRTRADLKMDSTMLPTPTTIPSASLAGDHHDRRRPAALGPIVCIAWLIMLAVARYSGL